MARGGTRKQTCRETEWKKGERKSKETERMMMKYIKGEIKVKKKRKETKSYVGRNGKI